MTNAKDLAGKLGSKKAARNANPDAEDMAVLQYTGGTTARSPSTRQERYCWDFPRA